MKPSDTAKPATAETVNGLRISEQLVGQLEIISMPSQSFAQPETALASAFRDALRARKAVAS